MRIVGLFFIDIGDVTPIRLASRMVKSVRKNIPDARVVQFTHKADNALSFVDDVVIRSANGMGLMEARIDHFANYPHDEALFLDPDILVQKDVWEVFDNPFDIAIAHRNEPLTLDGADVSKDMPYNTGVIFSRGVNFWRATLELMKPMSLDDRNWFGDQIAVAQLIKDGHFKVREIDNKIYNYSPKKESENVSACSIVHYKGNRKEWMLRRRESK